MKLYQPKTAFIFVFFFLSLSIHSQDFVRAKRFFLGLKGGVNFTQPVVMREYNVLSPAPGSPNNLPKEYRPMFSGSNIGGQFGVVALYYFNQHLALSIQPIYFNYNFSYLRTYAWQDTISQEQIDITNEHHYRLHYFELPVMLRYDILPGRFTPYIQAGGFLGFLHTANTSTAYTSTYDVPVQPGQDPPQTPAVAITRNINLLNAGIIGGAGICYSTDYVQVGLEANFRYGFLPVANARNRYSDVSGSASGYLDVMDDFTLMNLEISLTVIFPIGYGNGYNSNKQYCKFEPKKRKTKFKKRKR